MRAPMPMRCPALFDPGSTIDRVVANIDIAPTTLAGAGLAAAAGVAGADMLPPLARDRQE